jgi:hypothetical protein
MPGIIDSAPDCISSDLGTPESRVEDSADFVMGDTYTECAGFMTFGPGSTYGEEGVGAEGAYMVLTWIGIVAMVVFLVMWVALENFRLVDYVKHGRARRRGGPPKSPQPGTTGGEEADF